MLRATVNFAGPPTYVGTGDRREQVLAKLGYAWLAPEAKARIRRRAPTMLLS